MDADRWQRLAHPDSDVPGLSMADMTTFLERV